MSSSPAAPPTRARSVNGPLPQLLVGPGRLASPDVADPSPAAPRWLRLVPVRALTAPVACHRCCQAGRGAVRLIDRLVRTSGRSILDGVAVCGGRFVPARTAGADTSTVSTATPMAIDVITMLAQAARSCGTRCIEPDRAMYAIPWAWVVRLFSSVLSTSEYRGNPVGQAEPRS
jgi:hypothetical protein